MANVAKRTESEKIGKLPVKFKLGDQVYESPVLGINKSRVYRQLIADTLGGVFATFKENRPDFEAAMNAGIAGVFLRFPDKVAELVFAFNQDLPQEKILDEATEEQIAMAFLAIIEVVYPYLAQFGLMTEILRTTAP